MASTGATVTEDWPGRWSHIQKVLERTGPFAREDFEPSSDNLAGLKGCKILIVGAGGLGCELLKDLALMGFQNLHVIDMDTIDLSNLNRQFLFRTADVGRAKADVAAEFVNKRIPGCKVVPHFCKIQDRDDDFYRSFNIIVCGLDSVAARRWLNTMLCNLVSFDDDGNPDCSTIVPVVDGGTEGFQGNARVILPGLTPCIECTLSLYPPQVNYPMCTIAHTPRLPEHCVEYAKIILWPKERPFGDEQIDGDNPAHVGWVLQQAEARAREHSIHGVNYRLTQGVLKRIIPAVASTNAVVAAACAAEVFKLASNAALPMNNYMNFQDGDGIFAGVVELEKKEDCPVCSRRTQRLSFCENAKLRDVIAFLKESPDYQLKDPSIYAASKTLYMSHLANLRDATRPNLSKTLKELNLTDGSLLTVADETSPTNLEFVLSLTAAMDS